MCRSLSIVCIVLGLGAAASGAPATRPSAFYERIAAAYAAGRWEDLERELKAPTKDDLEALSAAQRADVAYVRQAMAECWPAWWKQIKTGRKTPFRPALFGRTLAATYDPEAKGVQLKWAGPDASLTLGWSAAMMDNPAPAEYGFAQADLGGMAVWHTLGMAAAFASINPQTLAAATDADKVRLQQSMDFRGNLAALAYGPPGTRRWCLHIFMAAFMEKYGKGPMAMPRRAAAAMFMGEVLGHPQRYPSIKLPDSLPPDGAEEKLAAHFKGRITARSAWTIAEDRLLRDAFKASASANDRAVYPSGKITLPNGQGLSLDMEADKPLRIRRESWLNTRLESLRR